MQDASFKTAESSRGNRGNMLISGTLITILAAGIGFQFWRSQNVKADQPAAANAGRATVSPLGKPVGRVNGQSISYEELARECIERHGVEVLKNVINRMMIQQACSQAGLTVSDAEVEQEIVVISKKFGLPVAQWETMLHAERGLTPLQYRRDVIWPMLALKKLAGEEVKITRAMMEEAYADNYGPRAKVRMMVLANTRHAQEIWDKVKAAPDEFEDYARDYSIEPNSKALGGTVPPVRRYSGAHEEIRKAAFRMKDEEPGEISGIIQVALDQYAILKFEGMTEPVAHDPKDVQGTLHEELRERQVQVMVGNMFKKIEDSARIDNLLTGETKSPVEQTSAADVGFKDVVKQQ